MNQQEFFGYGSISHLKDIITKEKARNIFLVTGKNSYESCGAKRDVERILVESNCEFTRFSDLTQNPTEEQIQQGLNLFLKSSYDTILSVGGGSPIDVAKEIKLRFFKQTQNMIPLVAVPTTAGSGSEATHFVVFYRGKDKQSGGERGITLPEYAIIDPGFTLKLPREIAASTGLDALGQAIESYWCINSNTESKKIASRAIELLFGNLETAVNSQDLQKTKTAKERVMLGANFAGKAICMTQTTACHSIAYPLTSYFNIPHGQAVALTLGEMFVYNSQVSQLNCNDSRGEKYVQETIQELTKLLHSDSSEQARQKIGQLIKSLGLKTNLSQIGLTNSDLDLIIEKAFNPARVKNNPRLLTQEDLKRILQNIF